MQEYGLIENAIHSFGESISYYNNADVDKNPDKYKFSILLIAQCAELLLKQILLNKHPAFLWVDIDKYQEKNDDYETVGYKSAIRRVTQLCGVDLSIYKPYLEELGTVRNRIQHYKFEINGEHHKQLMCRSFSAIEYLLKDVLGRQFSDYNDLYDETEFERFLEDEERIRKRLLDIKKEFREGTHKKFQICYDTGRFFDVPCPICNTKALSFDSSIKCVMCDSTFANYRELHDNDRNCFSMDWINREIGRRVKAGKLDVIECPECENDSMIYDENGSWRCLICGEVIEDSTHCDCCGEQMPNSDSYYYTVMSDEDTNDFMYFCPKCAKEAEDLEEYIGYNFSRKRE